MNVSDRPLAVVTGAARGLGANFARRLEGEGFEVARWDVAFAENDRAGDNRIVDVTNETEVEAAVTSFGRPIDLLVNNAGINRPVGTFDLDVSLWQRILDVNLTGALICARAAARTMRERGGAIVNIASIAGLVGFSAHSSVAYAASKGGLISMTRALAIEWAQEGIAVNAVAPAMVETDLTKARLSAVDYREAILGRSPAHALVALDAVADAVVYLASQPSTAVSGQVIVVDGGWTAS